MVDVREVDELRFAADRRHRDPIEVLALAEAGTTDKRGLVRAWAHWAAGLACHELSRPQEAIEHYLRAIEAAIDADDTDCEARARSNLSISLINQGRSVEAREQIDQAVEVAPPAAEAHVQLLVGLVEQRSGDNDAALAAYAHALPRLYDEGRWPDIARLQLNRGTLLAYTGLHDAALSDLAEAEKIADAEDMWILVAMAAHNTGFALGRTGRIVEALSAFERAEAAYHRQGDPTRLLAVLEADRCDLLVDAGLAEDAHRSAVAAIAALDEVAEIIHGAEARVLGAQAALAVSRLDDARRWALEAAAAFRAADRSAWAAWAEYLALRVDVRVTQDEDELPAPAFAERAGVVADALEAGGLQAEALHARTFVARLALASGDVETGRTAISSAVEARRSGSAAVRTQAWLASALLRLADGDRQGARRAIDSGLRIVEGHRATMGSTELRAAIAAAGDDLARLGLRVALQGGRPTEVFLWAERWRAASLRTPATRVLDEEGERRLRELHLAYGAARLKELTGGDGPSEAEIGRLEEAVRQHALAGSGQELAGRRVPPAELRSRLDDRTLVEFVELDRSLWAIVADRRRLRLEQLGSRDTVASEIDHVLFSLRRLAREAAPDRAAQRAGTLAASASVLDQLLLAPLGLPATGEMVIVPTGSLHAVPWAAMPTMAGRAITVAPSASLWAAPRPTVDGGVALVCGPGLPAALNELDQLRELHPGAEVISGTEATRHRLVEALGRASLAHIAAHGVFRADSPMFSNFALADGPVTLFDLESASSVPEVVVLPACDAGASSVRSGDELIGAAAALLQRGVRSVVAPLIAVPDEATSAFTLELHRDLVAGRSAGTAVAGARERVRRSGVPGADAVAAAFVVIGGDDRPLRS
ncbi:MAG: CHAT domain-containing tetratricopeptide repeat protein [Actinomycetota bacterium]